MSRKTTKKESGHTWVNKQYIIGIFFNYIIGNTFYIWHNDILSQRAALMAWCSTKERIKCLSYIIIRDLQ